MLILLAALVAGGFLPWELKVSGDFALLPQAEVSVTPQIDGTLRAITVKEGQSVKAGEVLAEIQNLDLTDAYEETKGELAAKMASLDLLNAGTRPEEIEKARRNIETKKAEYDTALRVDQERRVLMDTVAKAEAELMNAKKNYERSQNLLAAEGPRRADRSSTPGQEKGARPGPQRTGNIGGGLSQGIDPRNGGGGRQAQREEEHS
jgi:HlyD family secretion protein